MTSSHFQLAPPSLFAAGNQNERRKIKICYLLKKKEEKKQAQGKQSLWTLFCPGLFLVDATVACGLSCLLRFGSWDRFLFLYQSDYTCRYQTQVGNRRKESIVFRWEHIGCIKNVHSNLFILKVLYIINITRTWLNIHTKNILYRCQPYWASEKINYSVFRKFSGELVLLCHTYFWLSRLLLKWKQKKKEISAKLKFPHL